MKTDMQSQIPVYTPWNLLTHLTRKIIFLFQKKIVMILSDITTQMIC
jgi:hypothetical protein